MQKFLVFALISLLVLLGMAFYLKKDNPLTKGEDLSLVTPTKIPTASPTPIPFAELTIPYLRQRSYQSSLGELQPSSQNSLYTTYLTSYTSDGLKINGLLTKPTGEEPQGGWPAIVFVHGYIPPTQYRTLEKYSDHIDFLARNGFVVFKIDLRGHGSSEGEPGGGYYSSDYVIDTLNAYSALQTSGFVNPEKIALWGHSMAGNVTLRALAAKPEIKAVAIWAGAGFTYLDLRTYGISDNSYQPSPNDSERQRKRQQLRQLYGDPSADSQFWKQVIPTNYLTDVKGAVSLHHAQDDDVVSIEYSRNLNKILDQTSLPHQLKEYPSGGHNINNGSFNRAMQETVDFYKSYLLL